MNVKTLLLGVVLSLYGALPGWCREGDKAAEPTVGEPVEVELFAAVRSGQLQVVVVPQSYSLMTMRVRNNTPGTLRVPLPETFAAIPTSRWQTRQVLQQNGMAPSLANNYGPYQGGSQGLGGSLAGPWANGQAANGRKSADSQAGSATAPHTWTLAAGQMIQIQVPCFCLEYGKPDPNQRIPYQLVELQDLNDQPAVQELLKRFGQGDLDQRIAQLAAWHVANGTSWHMLAQVKFPRSSGRGGSGVLQRELLAAKQLSESLPSYHRQSSLGNR
jgi:hypothetical protein